MPRGVLTAVSALSLLAIVLPAGYVGAQVAPEEGCVKAGYGEADATWHVGVSAGQYASDRWEDDLALDPHAHHIKRAKSYGVQSRLFVRAIAVEGCNGQRIALVKNDNYLSSDMLQRRIGQILAAEGSQITYNHILSAASHNHSSPFVYSMAWGVQLFQDVFDIRAFEFHARKTAEAIVEAESNLALARMGATTVNHDIFKANIPGPEPGDDGTPAGYPRDFGDEGVVVMRFDNAATGEPIATWINHGQHPESLDGYDLITADFLAPLQRFVDRETGSPIVFSQGDVGSSEGPYDGWDVPQGRYLPDGTRRAWAHTGYAQAERGARYLADTIISGFNEIGNGGGQVPYSSNFDVDAYEEGWVPGPISHPYPSVWNCKTRKHATGDVEGPGLPTCGDIRNEIEGPIEDETGQDIPLDESDPTLVAIYEGLKQLGVPIPDHGPMNGPGHLAVEENNRLRLQVFKLGDVVLGSCACEAQVDLILNFETRADNDVRTYWDGYRYYDGSDPDHPEFRCVQNEANSTWSCAWPRGTTIVSDYYYQRMKAQVENPADGWDALEYVLFANSEPYEPEEIKGNFTKQQLNGEGSPAEGTQVLDTPGYKLAVGIGHATDYNGYTVSYREYMNRDSYRKSLTTYGPHTADYMVTRMVWMAEALNGGPDRIAADPYYKTEAADEARIEALAIALGQASGPVYDAWYAALPNDKNPEKILAQPVDIQRFDAATFSWIGGSNAVDNPLVEVQRLVDGKWTTYGDQSGEVQTFLEFPEGVSGVLETWEGEHEWRWTANFEAFNFGPNRNIDPRGVQVPEGEYRFVVSGQYRQDGADHGYDLTSEPFTVSKWKGIKVDNLRVEDDGTVSFTVSGAESAKKTEIAPGHPEPQIRYPRTYEAADVIRFIEDDGQTDICESCSFRPWAVGADVATATVTIIRSDGTTEQVPATRGEDGRWYTGTGLFEGDRAFVDRGGIVDTYGEINGERSAVVGGTLEPPVAAVTEYALLANSDVEIGGSGVSVDGDIHSNKGVKIGSGGQVCGDISAVGTVENKGSQCEGATTTEGASPVTLPNMADFVPSTGAATTTFNGDQNLNGYSCGLADGCIVWIRDGKLEIRGAITGKVWFLVDKEAIITGDLTPAADSRANFYSAKNVEAGVGGVSIEGIFLAEEEVKLGGSTQTLTGLFWGKKLVDISGSNSHLTGALISDGLVKISGSEGSVTYDRTVIAPR